MKRYEEKDVEIICDYYQRFLATGMNREEVLKLTYERAFLYVHQAAWRSASRVISEYDSYESYPVLSGHCDAALALFEEAIKEEQKRQI